MAAGQGRVKQAGILFLDLSRQRSDGGNGRPPPVRVFLDKLRNRSPLHDAKNALGSVPLKAFVERSTSTRAQGGSVRCGEVLSARSPWKAFPRRSRLRRAGSASRAPRWSRLVSDMPLRLSAWTRPSAHETPDHAHGDAELELVWPQSASAPRGSADTDARLNANSEAASSSGPSASARAIEAAATAA
jgi:hypothetical protein